MSDLLRSVCRNITIGLLSAFMCFIAYGHMITALSNSDYAWALIVTSTVSLFSVFSTLWVNDNDPPLFKHYVSLGRIATGITCPCTFLCLFFFHWWGLGAGFIGGALISTFALSLWGPKKPLSETDALSPTSAPVVTISNTPSTIKPSIDSPTPSPVIFTAVAINTSPRSVLPFKLKA